MILKKNRPQKIQFNKTTLATVLRFFVMTIMILIIGLLVATSLPINFRYQHYVIGSASMSPTIKVGDLVFIDQTFDLEDLKENDIIAFKEDIFENGTEEVVIHYLDAILEDGSGNTTFRTRRENTTTLDPWTLTEDDIVGRYLFHLPGIGKFLLFAQSTI